MENHFRIIQLPTHEVLLTRDFDNENEDAEFTLVITIFLEGVKVNMSLNYTDEKTRDKLFNEMTNEQAQVFLDKVNNEFN